MAIVRDNAGAVLRAERRRRVRVEGNGWTQQRVSDKLGIDRSYLAHIEGGRKRDCETIIRLAQFYGLPLERVLRTRTYRHTRQGSANAGC